MFYNNLLNSDKEHTFRPYPQKILKNCPLYGFNAYFCACFPKYGQEQSVSIQTKHT